MVKIDWSCAIQILNFLVLIYVLNMVLYKPIRKILLQRKAKIEGLQDGIALTAEQAEEKNQAFDKGIRQARMKGQKEKEVLMQTASDEEKALIGRLSAKAQEDMAAVKAQIVKDTDAVKKALEKEVDAFASAITEKILGRTAQ